MIVEAVAGAAAYFYLRDAPAAGDQVWKTWKDDGGVHGAAYAFFSAQQRLGTPGGSYEERDVAAAQLRKQIDASVAAFRAREDAARARGEAVD